jgi:hypothetical protein
MKRSQLREIIREAIKNELAENQPKPEQPNTPAPTITPEKPDTEEEEKKRRKIGRPDVEPKPKALKEEEMLKKIVDRYKSKSSGMNEVVTGENPYYDTDPSDGDADEEKNYVYGAENYYDKGKKEFEKGNLKKAQEYYKYALEFGSRIGWTKRELPPYKTLSEDLDLGHEDDEPHMLRADLYRIAKYAIELYKMLEPFDKMEGEVDLPQWWQEKIIKSKSMLVAAKHYLDFEMKEPSIDASLNGAAMEEVTDAQKKYIVKSSAKPTQFKQDIAAAKKMIDAGKLEKEVVLKYGQAVFNAVNAQNMGEGKKRDMNNDKKIDSEDYLLTIDAAIKKSKLKK